MSQFTELSWNSNYVTHALAPVFSAVDAHSIMSSEYVGIFSVGMFILPTAEQIYFTPTCFMPTHQNVL